MKNIRVRGLKITGVSIEGITGLDDLVCLCKEEEVSELISRESDIKSVD